jgi:hypothetical protein
VRQFAKSGGLIAGLRVSHCDPLIHRGERLVPRDGLPKVPASLAHRIHDLIRVVRPFFTANMQVLGIGRLALLAAVHPTCDWHHYERHLAACERQGTTALR